MNETRISATGPARNPVLDIFFQPSHEPTEALEQRADAAAKELGATREQLLRQLSGDQLAQALKRGVWRNAVLEVLTRRYFIGFGPNAKPTDPAIFNLLAARSNANTAAEVLQRVAMKLVLKGIPNFDATRSFKPYLEVICMNELRAFFRQGKRDRDLAPLPPNDMLTTDSRRLSSETTGVNLQWVLERLSAMDRDLLEQRSVSPARDIAERRKVSVKRVYRMLEAARRRAKQLFEQAPELS